jgi:hypothetical protein
MIIIITDFNCGLYTVPTHAVIKERIEDETATTLQSIREEFETYMTGTDTLIEWESIEHAPFESNCIDSGFIKPITPRCRSPGIALYSI